MLDTLFQDVKSASAITTTHARVHRRGDCDARAWHGCERDDLHAARCGAVQTAACVPAGRADRLRALTRCGAQRASGYAGGTGRYLRFSYPRFQLLQEALAAHGSLAASTLSVRFVGRRQGVANASAILTQLVSGRYFSTLGVAMQRGRPLSDSDMQRDARSKVAVISDGYWRTAFGRSEQAIGQTIDIKGVALTIVGVAAPGFVGIRTDSVAELWVPLTLQVPLGYVYNSSAYGGADRRQPWMDRTTSDG